MLDFVAHYLLFLSHSVTLTLSDLDLEKMAIIQNLDFPPKIFKVKVTCSEGHQIRKKLCQKFPYIMKFLVYWCSYAVF